MNLSRCGSISTAPENRTWYRAIQPQHLRTALQTAHTAAITSRFSDGGNRFEIIYLAENHTVALYEVQAMLGSPLHGVSQPNPFQAWTLLNVDVVLYEVADLTRKANQDLIETSAQELTGDWRSYRLRGRTTSVSEPTGTAPTQELGEALFRTEQLEGFRTVSAKVPTCMILGVFPRKLGPRSSLEFRDHTGAVIHRIDGAGAGP